MPELLLPWAAWDRTDLGFGQEHFRGHTQVASSFTRIHLLVLLRRHLFSLQILHLLPETVAIRPSFKCETAKTLVFNDSYYVGIKLHTQYVNCISFL